MDRRKLQDKIEIKTAALLSNSHNLKTLEQKGNAIMVFTDEVISLVERALAEQSNEQSNCNIHDVSVSEVRAEVCKCGSNLCFVNECKLHCSNCRKLIDVGNLQT